MARKYLDFSASVSLPHSAGFVYTRCYNFVTLRVELHLTNFILMTLQQCSTRACEYVVHAGEAISTGGRTLVTRLVEAGI
jgi:hypothetical protein